MKTSHLLILGGIAAVAVWYFFIRTPSTTPAPTT
jgi:hypothetical protein